MNRYHPPASAALVVPLHVTVTAGRDQVFAFLADVENLPRWAGEFCERLEISRRGWRAFTACGDLFLELEADAHTGVIDIRVGDDAEPLAAIPLRVWARPDGATLVSCHLVQAPGQDAIAFARQRDGLAAGLAGLAERWPDAARRLCA